MNNIGIKHADLCSGLRGVRVSYKAEWGWYSYKVGGKLFAVTCRPSEKYAPEYALHTLLTLKCDPMEAEFLCAHHADILPGFYMDKKRWISLRTDGDITYAQLKKMFDAAYRLVFSSLTKKLQAQTAKMNEGVCVADE